MPVVTPVIITRAVRWAEPAEIEAVRSEVRAAVEAWADSIRAGDMHGYLSLYADNFAYRGMDRSEWASYRLATLGTAAIDDLLLDDMLLLADPEDESLFLSRFRQTIVEAERNVVTTKRLYWRRDAEGDLRIVAEDNG